MRVLVTGATGYIGGRLVPKLTELGHDVRCMARDVERLARRFEGVELVQGDVFDRASVLAALEGVDVAYYLVHSMSAVNEDFAASDRQAAAIFGDAARDAGIARIVYLGGLGEDDAALSKHLRSRHEVGDVLRRLGVPTTEFRAAIIVGSGSMSFEMVRYLTDRLPLMVAPKWVQTRCQPIAVRDVLSYLCAELGVPRDGSVVREIGGSNVLTYREMMLSYARVRGLAARKLIVVPGLSPRLSSLWINLVTPIPSSIARPLVDGLVSEVVVRDDVALREFPDIHPISYEEAVQKALDRYAVAGGVATTWFDAYDVRSLPGQFAGDTQGMLVDRRRRDSIAPPSAVSRVFSGLGGRRGWLYADFLWEIRGIMDRMVGGIGTRRGRRSQDDLRIGDAVDFWRVEAYEPGRILRLRAEMKLPGRAWLQFEVAPMGAGCTLQQTAFYEPHGSVGLLYWYAVLPFHGFIFKNMASRVVEIAEGRRVAPLRRRSHA